jgi:hypothetical protein
LSTLVSPFISALVHHLLAITFSEVAYPYSGSLSRRLTNNPQSSPLCNRAPTAFDCSYEITALIGVTVTVKVAHVRLFHSRMLFVCT